jgi:hypothetical protein
MPKMGIKFQVSSFKVQVLGPGPGKIIRIGRRAAAAMAATLLISCGGPGTQSGGSPCRPPAQTVNFNGTFDEAASARLQALCDAQAASRASDQATLSELVKTDEARRVEVMAMLHDGRLAAPRDLHLAGTLFYYSTCADHLRLAMELARRAWERGSADSWALYVRTARRYLEMRGTKAPTEASGDRTWANLDAVTRQFDTVEPGVFRVPLKLPSSLEAQRGSLEGAVLSAQRMARNTAPGSGKSTLDRAAIFDDEAAYGKVLDQIAAGRAATDLPGAVLAERTLVALSLELAAKRDPSISGNENYVRMLAQALQKPGVIGQ